MLGRLLQEAGLIRPSPVAEVAGGGTATVRGPAGGAAAAPVEVIAQQLATGACVFVRFAGEPEDRPLHRGLVIAMARRLCTIEFPESVPVGHHGAAQIHYREDMRFFVVPAERRETLQIYPCAEVRFVIRGAAERVERRREVRASVAGMKVMADFSKAAACNVLDLSNEGFSATGPDVYRVGETVVATLRHGDSIHMGEARVMNRVVLRDGRVRLGFHVPETQSGLRQWLQATGAVARRRQLGRLASKR